MPREGLVNSPVGSVNGFTKLSPRRAAEPALHSYAGRLYQEAFLPRCRR
jgi:hypothetical protein